jgi:hypothetical protein
LIVVLIGAAREKVLRLNPVGEEIGTQLRADDLPQIVAELLVEFIVKIGEGASEDQRLLRIWP